VALKRAYVALYREIVIGPEGSDGKRTITYVLRDGGVCAREDRVCLMDEMVEAVGVEPTSGIPANKITTRVSSGFI